MEPLLGSSLFASLEDADVLVAFDFDGTLAPLVDEPASAAVPASTRRLLGRLAHLYPCAVISGRSEADLSRLLAGITVWYAIGNRFLDSPETVERRREQVRTWVPQVAAQLSGLEGISVEDKGAALAIHYRAALDAQKAREAIWSVAEMLGEARVIPGNRVINLLPWGSADKGAAVERLSAMLGCKTILYVGDDTTDEDAFGVGANVIGVRIGESKATRARYYLHSREEVDALLERLIGLRERAARAPERIVQRRAASGTLV
ncbi:MAG: trehalose-phosphatase [Myxococcales bacterium]